MARLIRRGKPLDPADYPGRPPLRRQLRRCSCGCMTFLDLPCRRCGRSRMQPEFARAHRQGARRLGRLMAGMLACTLAACWLVSRVWVWLAVLPVVLLAFALFEWTEDGLSLYETFFLFHPWKRFYSKQDLTTADYDSLVQIQQAYDGDLRRLEDMLAACQKEENQAEEAEKIFCLGLQLANVYHNRRLSALLAHCLLLMQPEEGVRVDMELVCRYLWPQDLLDMASESELLDWLDSWVKASCLPAGQYTARALVRICGLRVESSMCRRSPLSSCRGMVEDDCLTDAFTPLEISKLQAVWLSCGFADRWLGDKKTVLEAWEHRLQAGLLDMDLMQAKRQHLAAWYWSDVCWYEADELPWQGLMKLLDQCPNPQERELLQSWGREAAE